MSSSPAQPTLLPPPARLELAPDLLEPRGFVDWQMSPWLSERLRGILLPLQVEDLRVLISWDGSGTVRLFRDGVVRIQGRTGAFGSVLTTTRTGATTTVRGFQDDQTVDYLIEEDGDEIRVEGDTGRFRSRYTIRVAGSEVSLVGDHGEFDSNYTARCSGDVVMAEGIRGGERVECRFAREGNVLRIQGAYLGSHSELALEMAEREWLLSGMVYGERIQLALRLVDDGIEFVGSVPPGGLVNFKLHRTEEGLWVRGKANHYHLNYRIVTQGAHAEAVGAVVGAPAVDPAVAAAAVAEIMAGTGPADAFSSLPHETGLTQASPGYPAVGEGETPAT